MTNSFPSDVDLTATEDGKAEIVVSYDVRDGERRSKVRKICSEYGQWVQRSLFRFTLTEDDYQDLIGKLRRATNEEKDHVCAYLVPHPTEETTSEWGTPKPLEEVESIIQRVDELDEGERSEFKRLARELLM